MKLVLISDTHGRHRKVTVPDGDVLIHAGDLTMVGELSINQDAAEWLASLPHQHKIVIAGNHDFGFENSRKLYEDQGIKTLLDESCTVNELNFYGSPYTPVFFDWAFMKKRGDDLYQHWLKIPTGTDILVTHGPPKGILDQAIPDKSEHVGDDDLKVVVQVIRPKLHVFGHIHGSGGKQVEIDGVKYVNASVVDEAYQPVHAVQTIEL